MASAPRYWNVFRRTPSGRDQKRILNRTATCPLCTNPSAPTGPCTRHTPAPASPR